MENIARKFGLQINQEETKYMKVERKNSLKKNKIGHLKIKNHKFERVYENEKENWRILTNKEIYAGVKKTYYNRDNKVK
jgi:hypothetical protein